MKLYLDDTRTPNDKEFKIVRSYEEAIKFIELEGFPKLISFDHDLGLKKNGKLAKTGYDLAKWIVNKDMDGQINIPKDFRFNVHSANPIGKKDIEDLLLNYLKFKFSQ